MKIKRGDQVVVISGVHASDAPHRVTEVVDGGEKLLVEGVNLVFRHVKRGHPKSPQEAVSARRCRSMRAR